MPQGTAQAAPPAEPKSGPAVDEVQAKIDALYQQAGAATQRYNATKQRTVEQHKKTGEPLDQVASQTQKLNESRRVMGSYASAQYRTGPLGPTANPLFSDDPQAYVNREQLLDHVNDRQREAVEDYQVQRVETAEKLAEATESLERLTESQDDLKAGKQEVQRKLAEARELLSELTAEEKARLAALEKKRGEEAQRRAEALARQQAEEAAEAEKQRRQQVQDRAQQQAQQQYRQQEFGSTGSSVSGSSPYAAKAAKVLAFAEAQLGKPYVWGASGPNSYDCSGLTQAAWKAAGISLPRTTWDQVEAGTRVATADLQPGDLIFFYDDISHVGVYIDEGKMVHAPKPGTTVRIESIYYMPIYGGVRPA